MPPPAESIGNPGEYESLKDVPFYASYAVIPKSGEITTCEDAVLLDGRNKIFAVFDGAGGVRGGRRASHLASETLSNHADDIHSGSQTLSSVMPSINRAVLNDQEAGITTVSAVHIREYIPERKGYLVEIFSAGDSRIYLVKNRGTHLELLQITVDDSKISERYERDAVMRAKRGKRLDEIFDEDDSMSEFTLAEFNERNKIGNGLGVHREVTARQDNSKSLFVPRGYGILITSDGVHDNLVSNPSVDNPDIPEEYIIQSIIQNELRDGKVEDLPRALVQAARNVVKGGTGQFERFFRKVRGKEIIRSKNDDITALYVHLGDPNPKPNQAVESIAPPEVRSHGRTAVPSIVEGNDQSSVIIDPRRVYSSSVEIGKIVPGQNLKRKLEQATRAGDFAEVQRLKNEFGLN